MNIYKIPLLGKFLRRREIRLRVEELKERAGRSTPSQPRPVMAWRRWKLRHQSWLRRRHGLRLK
jgi:hypothetical protein